MRTLIVLSTLALVAIQSPAAEKEAEALRSRGEAKANVVIFDYKARAEPLARPPTMGISP